MIPAWSAPSSSSRSERIIPSETSPRSFARSSGFSAPGRTAPGSATATVAPAPKFQAPQTICRGSPSPTSTWQSWSRSAFGCLPASSTRPTRKRPRLPSSSGTPRRWIALELEGRDGEPLGDLDGGRVDVDVLAQPRHGDPQGHVRTGAAGGGRSPRARGCPAGRAGASPSARARSRTRTPRPPPGRSRRAAKTFGSTTPAPPISIQPGVAADAAAGAVAEEAGDVRLDRRLGEGEVARPDAHLAVGPVQLAREVADRALQVGERDPLVDGEALDLVEERRVRRVRRVAAVAAAEADHVDRRLVRLHEPDLARARSACAGAGRR